MAAYAIIHVEVLDQDVFSEFSSRVVATIEAHGGKYLVRGGAVEVMEGDWEPDRIVVVEFGSAEQARAWQNSPECAELREIKMRSANTNVVIVQGV